MRSIWVVVSYESGNVFLDVCRHPPFIRLRVVIFAAAVFLSLKFVCLSHINYIFQMD